MTGPDALGLALRSAGPVLLTGPVGPDGDSLGACLAFGWWLGTLGVPVTLAGCVPRRYAGLVPDGAFVPDAQVPPAPWGAVVVLDGDRLRLPRPLEVAFGEAPIRAVVDHHRSTTPDGYTHAWIEPGAESTCTMIHRELVRHGVAVPPEVAAWLYMGIVFDTGGFRHSNTTPDTHRTAAALLSTGIDHPTVHARVLSERSPGGLRAMGTILATSVHTADGRLCVGRVPLGLQRAHALVDGDLEGVVECLLHTEGTWAAALLVEKPDGTVKISLRSRTDLDVCALARHLAPTGGGHPRASGATVRTDLDDTARRIEALVRAASRSEVP